MTTLDRGMRLSYLRHFINEHGGQARFAGKTTAQVCLEFVMPLTKPSELSLVDHAANDPSTASFVAPANWYVSHAWQYLFLETVDSLERFFADRGRADDAVLWFCVFNNNQHLASSYPFEYWSSTFKTQLAAIGNVVMIMHPWNDPIVLRRSWCVFEVYVAVTMGARFEIALARDQEAMFLNDVTDSRAIYKMLATIKSEDSEATIPSDRDGIFALIRAETSFIAVDRLIFTTLTRWIKAALEAAIESTPSLPEKARRWCHLGLVYDHEDDHVESEHHFRLAVDLYSQCNGLDDVETLRATAYQAYAIACQRRPRDQWAPLFESTLMALDTTVGPMHAAALSARWNYGSALERNRDPRRAVAVHLELFELQRHKFGLGDKHTAATMGCIGKEYRQLGSPRIAARWLSKALPILEAAWGVDHKEVVATVVSLAGALLGLGERVRASALLRRLVASSERTLGAEHTTTIAIRLNSAIAELLAGNVHEATTQFMALQAILHATPRLAGYQHYVDYHLGLAQWVDFNFDDAVTHYLAALAACPNKENAWSLFRVVIAAPPTAVVCEALSRVRSYVASMDDAEAETWPVTCLTCYKPIVGSLVACTACPNGLTAFCTTCLERHPRRLEKLCAHDLEATAFRMTLPLQRYFLQDALMSPTASYVDLDTIFGAYERHCDAYAVPSTNRLPRTAMPGWNHGWHPML